MLSSLSHFDGSPQVFGNFSMSVGHLWQRFLTCSQRGSSPLQSYLPSPTEAISSFAFPYDVMAKELPIVVQA